MYNPREVSLSEETEVPELEYPCLVIEGVNLLPELEFYKKQQSEEGAGLHAYAKNAEYYISLGRLNLDLDMLCTLRGISTEYKVYVYNSFEDRREVCYTDAKILEGFIRL